MKSSNKLVAGVGLNDSGYAVVKFDQSRTTGKRSAKVIWKCPYYDTWANMLSRAYGSKSRLDAPTYLDVEVDKSWHTFSIFRMWMEQQDWLGKCLDKDILKYGSRVYSPETCCFVSHATNLFVSDDRRRRSPKTKGLPVGVALDRASFRASLFVPGQLKRNTKRFSTKEDAHLAWAEAKLAYVADIAEREQLEDRVHRAILDRYMAIVESARAKVMNLQLMAQPLAA